MKNMPKPDDRSDNVSKIKNHIDNTIANYRETEKVIEIADDEKQKKDLEEKNKRREQSLKSMKKEIKDEAQDRKNNYK